MNSTNERAPGERGAEELRTSLDCTADRITEAQRELFGVAAGADDCTTTDEPCPRCGATVATIGPGAGPHYAELRCLRGHHLRWLPKPGGQR